MGKGIKAGGWWEKRNYRSPKLSPGLVALDTDFERPGEVGLQVSYGRKSSFEEELRRAMQKFSSCRGHRRQGSGLSHLGDRRVVRKFF